MLFSKDYIKEVIQNKLVVNMLYCLQYPAYYLLAIFCYIPIVAHICETIARCWSVSITGFILRAVYWHTKLASMGKDVFIDRGVSINNPRNVYIGHNVYLDENVIIRTTQGKLYIGDYVRISACSYIQSGGDVVLKDRSTLSSYCRIYSQTHYYKNDDGEVVAQSSMVREDEQHIDKKVVVVGEGALLGTNSTLLPGAYIGDYSTIGAHSMVDSIIPAYCVAVGCPTKVIKIIDRSVDVKIPA